MRYGNAEMPSLLMSLPCLVLGPQSKLLYQQHCGRVVQCVVWFFRTLKYLLRR